MKRSLTRRVPFFVTMLTAALIVVGWRVASAAPPCVPEGQTCRTDHPRCCGGVCVQGSKKSFGTCCTPTTCAAAGANCGMIADGCGGTLDCGTCTLPQTCGGGGTPNVCGLCSPTTCAAAGANCGTIADGCGGTLDCGPCTLPQPCGGGAPRNGSGCSPTTCAAEGANCGTIADGCGGTLDCGTCTLPQTCGGCPGMPNVCGVAPVCGDGIRDVCEQCDGGAYCTASCTLPSLAPGCCQGGIPGCADASGFSLDFNMHQFCLAHGYATNVPGGVCSQAGTCDGLLLQPVTLCCESNTDGTCGEQFPPPGVARTVTSTGELWRFFNTCEGITNRAYHTVPAATCGPAGTCVPG